ncbi:MAG: competence/damage-inducible protein A [bacterium]|nr:competence/damage-inducible protein A [bacterium]
MNAEIVTIGTELLLGQIVDTNAAYIADRLNRVGVGVIYKSTVGDNPDRMREVLDRALNRVDVVITSGGIGPTEDDLTREIAAEVTGRPLVFQERLLEQIQRFFTKRGLACKDNNRRQAYIPQDAILIENPQGTAPGYIIESERGILLSLPGVPREMKFLMQQTVLPYLKAKSDAQTIKYRVLKLCGIGESHVDHAIGDLIRDNVNPTIGLLAHQGQIDIRIAAKADTEEQADRTIAELEQHIRERLPHQIFGADAETQEGVIVGLLHERRQSLAIAESNSGGHIAQQFIALPGIEEVLRGAIVAMDAESLQRLLPQDREAFVGCGFISPEMAKAMAQAVARACGARIGLGISGFRQSEQARILDSPVPSYIALYKEDGSFVIKEYQLSGPPEIVQTRVKNMALELLRRDLLGIHAHFKD